MIPVENRQRQFLVPIDNRKSAGVVDFIETIVVTGVARLALRQLS